MAPVWKKSDMRAGWVGPGSPRDDLGAPASGTEGGGRGQAVHGSLTGRKMSLGSAGPRASRRRAQCVQESRGVNRTDRGWNRRTERMGAVVGTWPEQHLVEDAQERGDVQRLLQGGGNLAGC